MNKFLQATPSTLAGCIMAGGGIDAAPPVQGVIFDLDGACRACKQPSA